MNSQIGKILFDETGCVNRDMLLMYRDKQLSPTQQHAVEKHLIDCPLCSDALEGLSLITSSVILDEIRDKVKHQTNPDKNYYPKTRIWYAAASVVALSILSYFAYQQIKESKTERFAVSENISQQLPVEIKPEVDTPDSIVPPAVTLNVQGATGSSFQWSSSDVANAVVTDSMKTGGFTYADKEIAAAAELEEPNKPTSYSVTESVARDEDIIEAAPSAKGNNGTYDLKDANNSNNITYIDNVKVIDYNFDNTNINNNNTDNYLNSATPSKYENHAKKQEEQKKEVVQKRKTTYLNILTDPIILFNKGRYDSAISGFDEVLKINPNDTNALFYKGLSYYHLNSFKQAIKLLQPISLAPGTFKEEAEFYLAKSYVGNGDDKKAKELLEKIVRAEGFYSKDAATELHSLK